MTPKPDCNCISVFPLQNHLLGAVGQGADFRVDLLALLVDLVSVQGCADFALLQLLDLPFGRSKLLPEPIQRRLEGCFVGNQQIGRADLRKGSPEAFGALPAPFRVCLLLLNEVRDGPEALSASVLHVVLQSANLVVRLLDLRRQCLQIASQMIQPGRFPVPPWS